MLPGGMPPQAWAPSTPTLDELHSDFSRLALPELHSLARYALLNCNGSICLRLCMCACSAKPIPSL